DVGGTAQPRHGLEPLRDRCGVERTYCPKAEGSIVHRLACPGQDHVVTQLPKSRRESTSFRYRTTERLVEGRHGHKDAHTVTTATRARRATSATSRAT